MRRRALSIPQVCRREENWYYLLGTPYCTQVTLRAVCERLACSRLFGRMFLAGQGWTASGFVRRPLSLFAESWDGAATKPGMSELLPLPTWAADSRSRFFACSCRPLY